MRERNWEEMQAIKAEGRTEIKREKSQEREERARKRGEREISTRKRARRWDMAHKMKTTEGGGREDDRFGDRGRRRTGEGEAKQEG